jgi:hypothetical protein
LDPIDTSKTSTSVYVEKETACFAKMSEIDDDNYDDDFVNDDEDEVVAVPPDDANDDDEPQSLQQPQARPKWEAAVSPLHSIAVSAASSPKPYASTHEADLVSAISASVVDGEDEGLESIDATSQGGGGDAVAAAAVAYLREASGVHLQSTSTRSSDLDLTTAAATAVDVDGGPATDDGPATDADGQVDDATDDAPAAHRTITAGTATTSVLHGARPSTPPGAAGAGQRVVKFHLQASASGRKSKKRKTLAKKSSLPTVPENCPVAPVLFAARAPPSVAAARPRPPVARVAGAVPPSSSSSSSAALLQLRQLAQVAAATRRAARAAPVATRRCA